jgi:hypothetical protein
MITDWTDSVLLQDLFGFLLVVFILRVARFTVMFGSTFIEECLLKQFAGKKMYKNSWGNNASYEYGEHESEIKAFFQKVDYLVNKLTILGIRWHYVAAFLYIVIQGHILHSR